MMYYELFLGHICVLLTKKQQRNFVIPNAVISLTKVYRASPLVLIVKQMDFLIKYVSSVYITWSIQTDSYQQSDLNFKVKHKTIVTAF